MAFKCKICGGETTVDMQSGIALCDYCGTKQALPLFTEDSERLLYESGNNYLSHSEYDKAEQVFNQLLTIRPSAAELYWDLVLCKYGVTYVKDPKTDKYIPTCNRTHYTPIFSDENYKKAISLSSGEKRELFEEDAHTIDNIQKGIIAVSRKEKPFDIFISYKESDSAGNRTKDSIKAQNLYEKLTEAGYKVFFSRITLEDKIGTEYEPYIYAALYSSKVMLTVCSSSENIEAVWVKNEWSRFLGFRQNDASKTLLPLYFDMDKAQLPEEFSLLSAYDMQADGFEEELLRGIKKLIPLPILRAKRRKKIAKAIGGVAAGLVVVAGIAAAVIISQKMEEKRLQEEAEIRASEEAVRASEEAVQASEEAEQERTEAEATEQAYQEALALFQNRDYTGAEAAFIALGDYKDAAQMAERCSIQPEYDAAMQLYYDGKYAQATWAFEALGDYEDAAEQKKKAELSWRKSLANAMSASSFGTYGRFYITPNGTVARQDTGVEVYEAGEHGKVVSIANRILLHEDGTVDKVTEDELWQDIVQIAPENPFTGYIALKADGRVIMAESETSQWYVEDPMAKAFKSAYSSVSQWDNIVQLSSYSSYGEGVYDSATAGVDADGEVYLIGQAYYGGDIDGYVCRSFMDHPDIFTNIKKIKISMGKMVEGYIFYVNAVALTHDGKLLTYINGEVSVKEAADVVDVYIENSFASGTADIYRICTDGKLYLNSQRTALLNDAVSFSDSYVVTRSGFLYEKNWTDGSYQKVEGCKTAVHDEWLLEME